MMAIDAHLRSNEEKLLQDFAETEGLDVAFRRTNLDLWEHFPRVTLTVDSLVVRDTLLPRHSPALLAVERFETQLNLGRLLQDTVLLERVALRGGQINLLADSNGRFNYGDLLAPSDTTETSDYFFSAPLISYDDSQIVVDDVEVDFRNPPRDKHLSVALHSVRTQMNTDGAGEVRMVTRLDAHVAQLAFNTEKGAYLRDSPLSGTVEGLFARDRWYFPPTDLRIGEETFGFEADIDRAPGRLSYLYFTNDSTDYEGARALMHDTLQAKLAQYYVGGRFPVRATVATTLERGENPEVTIETRLTGQDVRIQQYDFTDVDARIRIVNRLDEANHGIPGSRKNLRGDVDSLSAYWGPIRMRGDRLLLAAFAQDARLSGPMQFSGPTRAVSEWLQNENFFFEGGTFDLAVNVDASLLDEEEMIASTDGELRLRDLDVLYAPAGVRLPFRAIDLRKQRDDVSFRIQSRPLTTGFTFALDGQLDNLTPLLVDVAGERLRSQVNLYAPRIDWTDFLAFFGEDGMLVDEDRDTTITPAAGNQAVKQTLLGLRTTFQPDITARFDTVAYYDVFSLADFRTGLRFDGDTMVLERTAFHWAGSDISFEAGLDLGRPDETPFLLNVTTDGLDLNRLRPTLDYFGLKLPRGLDTLPSNLHIGFYHAGIIDDTFGIRPGFNVGNLDFDDGERGLFSGNMNYRPGPRGLATNFHLSGKPRFVNELFRAENFFFGGGSFDIDLNLEGTPADLPALISTSRMQLRIDSSRINYRPGGVDVPVKSFAVDVDRGEATYTLDLLNNDTRRSVAVSGKVDRLVGFLYPEAGETYSIETDVSASLLHLSDITGFFTPSSGRPQADTGNIATQDALSTTGSIFGSLRPNLTLSIDTFFATDRLSLTEVSANLYVRDSTQLVLERSGFHIGEGSVALAATYQLDERADAPFHLDLDVERIDVERVVDELRQLELPLLPEIGTLGGVVSLHGDLAGRFDEDGTEVDLQQLSGKLDYEITDIELADWPPLADIGRKLMMRRRFEHLRFAPLTGELAIDSGRVTVPRTEIQSTALQLFVEGYYDMESGPNLLLSVPLRNIGRGVLKEPPPPTGYESAGWKVYLVARVNEEGEVTNKFRLGKRRWFDRLNSAPAAPPESVREGN